MPMTLLKKNFPFLRKDLLKQTSGSNPNSANLLIPTQTDTDMEEKRFLYVLFLITPFGTGKLIRTVTGFSYNHMGIAFSPEIKYFYSFARYNKKTPFFAGFTKESALRYNNNGKIAKVKICAVPVSEENYQEAKKYLDYIKDHADDYIYNFASAVSFPFRKRVIIKKSYTCAEFVLSMLRRFSDVPGLREEKFLSIKETCEILDPYTVYEGSIEKFFEGADWEGDAFLEEKSVYSCWKDTFLNILRMFRRLIKNEE